MSVYNVHCTFLSEIFPEANVTEESDSSSYPEDFLYSRERLPSIVVEPTEHSELESGDQCWHPEYLNNLEEENSSADNTEDSENQQQNIL
uniref:LBH domain-containing protein n=1 Tax=Monopterus albus TaxID=43700 RepID=A0A3Q3K9D9_MONAL